MQLEVLSFDTVSHLNIWLLTWGPLTSVVGVLGRQGEEECACPLSNSTHCVCQAVLSLRSFPLGKKYFLLPNHILVVYRVYYHVLILYYNCIQQHRPTYKERPRDSNEIK
jgi:hypothetical protein